MSQENLISFTLTEEKSNEVDTAINTLENVLVNALITLRKKERVSLVKMGPGNYPFVKDCYGHMLKSHEHTPSYIDSEEMRIDIEAYEKLGLLYNKIEEIRSAIDDSIMLSGSEALTAALAYYKYITGASQSNVPGTKSIYENLKKRFVK